MIATHPRRLRLLIILLVLLALACAWLVPLPMHAQSADDPQLVARLDTPTSATVSWTATRRLCLSYNGVFAACRPAGRNTITFGHVGPLDGTLRPAVGGVYVLSDPQTGATWRARLAYWRWLAIIRR